MYSYQAIEKYGVFKGIKMSINRVSRCNVNTPMGTYDPV
jgi:putative component of membrane protein insertase Oxa1/YidC/SpoIIIJ protein YidD